MANNPFVEKMLSRRSFLRWPGLSDLREECARPDSKSSGTVAIIAPHSDDAELAMGALTCWLVDQGWRVAVLLLYAGYRAPGTEANGDTDQMITDRRVREADEACQVTGAELSFLDVSAYRRRDKDYLPSDEDIEQLSVQLGGLNPDWIFMPPHRDLHVAHQAARELTALAVHQAGLRDVRFVSYESPWGTIRPTHFFAYCGELQERKVEAISHFRSQLTRTDYLAWSRNQATASLVKCRELITGHSNDDPCPTLKDKVGVEFFQLARSVPANYPDTLDPVDAVIEQWRMTPPAQDSPPRCCGEDEPCRS